MPVEHPEPYTVASMGGWAELSRRRGAAAGKIFLSPLLKLENMDVSVNALKPGWLNPYLHRHVDHEELYVFIKGRGEMKLDERVIEVKEGDLVRISPPVSRGIRNPETNTEELWFLCIRASRGPFILTDAEGAGPVDGVEGWSFDKLVEKLKAKK